MTMYDCFSTPIGTVTAASDGSSIVAVHIEGDRYFTSTPDEWMREPKTPVLVQLKRELDEYFSGKRTQFDVPVLFTGTDFQRSVWRALQAIPHGEKTSYGTLAEKIGKPKAVRAVGTAIGHNPLCIVVPCHRVLASDGTLGGYVAGLDRKQYLLTLEGAL